MSVDIEIVDFQTAESYLNSKGGRIDLNLGRIRTIMEHLGSAHLAVPTILVAGTNGKGTVAVSLATALAERYRVGLSLKPHLHTVRERARLLTPADAGNPVDSLIPESEFTECIKLLQQAQVTTGVPITFFEITFALGLLWFVRARVDIAVVEVGLGGRLDASNICDPILSIVTNIAFDHEAYLGDTLEKIAREKVAIYRPGRPALAGIMDPSVQQIVLDASAELDITPQFCKTRFDELCINEDGKLQFRAQGAGGYDGEYSFSLIGKYQSLNLPVVFDALVALEVIGFKVTETQLAAALRKVYYPGRFEYNRENDIIFDGAHNEAGVQALLDSLEWWALQHNWDRDWQLDLIFGCQVTKDARKLLEVLKHRIRFIYPVSVPQLHPMDVMKLVEIASNLGLSVGLTYDDWQDTVEFATGVLREYPLLVAGSLYALGDIRAFILGAEV